MNRSGIGEDGLPRASQQHACQATLLLAGEGAKIALHVSRYLPLVTFLSFLWPRIWWLRDFSDLATNEHCGHCISPGFKQPFIWWPCQSSFWWQRKGQVGTWESRFGVLRSSLFYWIVFQSHLPHRLSWSWSESLGLSSCSNCSPVSSHMYLMGASAHVAQWRVYCDFPKQMRKDIFCKYTYHPLQYTQRSQSITNSSSSASFFLLSTVACPLWLCLVSESVSFTTAVMNRETVSLQVQLNLVLLNL